MSEEEFNSIFARRLKYYIDMNGITQLELSKKLHVSSSTVTDWVYGRRTPRMDKVDAMCEIFGITRNDLITDKTSDDYYEEETKAIAQEIANNKDLRMLMDTARDMDPEKIKNVHDYLLFLKNHEMHTED